VLVLLFALLSVVTSVIIKGVFLLERQRRLVFKKQLKENEN